MEELFSQKNQIISIVLIGVLLLLLMAVALFFFFFISRKKIVEKELEKKSAEIEHQKEMIHATILTQENERKRISQDLHDDISSKLNVIHLNSNLLLDGGLTAEEYSAVTKSNIDITNRTLQSARKIAHDLLPPILDKFGLQSAIEELVDDFNTSKKVVVTYQLKYPENHLKKSKELHLFRILQELINNSIRHGKAKNINLVLKINNEKLSLTYSDDGIGFDLKQAQLKKGLGLKNIESRVELLNGTLKINSKEKSGATFIIHI
ncbi:Oxygen sensor histidine kinase NreB [Polaribacter huanghezhanensis]|uniref:sensor histidine kinase n=1 Tax=Polaribacter huanghezhanensis TaxID=1354726 RepID=UPI002647ABEE|nr:sensor histidine kinase [Polaribacter huanghezhanensis]WKD85611.1 Oxygen sensor histidine kinase NreB [Polaribacter huanghezhanensis]